MHSKSLLSMRDSAGTRGKPMPPPPAIILHAVSLSTFEELRYNHSAMNITVTHPFTISKYGSYKRYHLHMLKVKAFILKHWTRLVKNFDITRDVEVRLRPLPRRRTQGNHRTKGGGNGGNHHIQLDISKPLRTLIETLFHELQHAEQIEQGRLKHVFNGRWEWVWNDVNHGRNCGFGQTHRQYQRYRNQPWEADADQKMVQELALFETELGYQLESSLLIRLP